jgi:hypothetical protein
MHTIQLTSLNLTPDAVELEGQYLDSSHYDRVVEDSTTVLKPDGTPLLIYERDALPRSLCRLAFHTFKDAPLNSSNRGSAAGGRFRPVKKDGSRSRTAQSKPSPSGVVGFLDADRRFPACRMTALTLRDYSHLKTARPFLAEVSRQFQMLAPERWAAQRAFIEKVSPDFYIPDTVFTTVTVNRSWRTAAHRDDEDYRPGFGVMTALEGGHYAGCELIFPKYRTAVDLRTGGLLLADVHELHGNGPLIVRPPHQRLSFVFYARERMHLCGSADEELSRVKSLADGGAGR